MMWNTCQNYHREFDGAIFMCNRKTKKECLKRGLFGLPPSQAGFLQKVKSGMILFLFEYEQRKLFGVFEACSDGGIDIVPDAFSSLGKSFSSQVHILRVWSCYPLSEPEFYNALKDNYYTSNKFHFFLKKKQVENLIILFSSKKIKKQVSGDTEMHYRSMDRFKKHGQGMSAMNEDEKSVEEKVSEKKVAVTSVAICKPYFAQMDYLNKLRGQGFHSEDENNSSPYGTVSTPCSDASTAGDFLGEDRSDLPQYSIPCLQYLQDPFSSEIEHYSKQALVQELTRPSIRGSLMLADDPMLVPYSSFDVSQVGMETSDFSRCEDLSRCEADFSSSEPLVCGHGFGLQDLENVNEVDSDVHYLHHVYPSLYTDRYGKRTSAFERLSFTPETVMNHENNVDVSAHELIELLAERRKRWRVPAHKKERVQHFCGIGKEHQTEEVEVIVTLEVDDEACTWFQEADHGKRKFPNFRRRSDIPKESKTGGTSEEGDLKGDSCHVTKRRKLIRPLSKMPSSVEHVSKENKAENQAGVVAIGQCVMHLLKQNSEDAACEQCEGLQGSFQNVIGFVGCIDQNVVGQEQQKRPLQETGSNSGQLDVPQSALSVSNTSGDQIENQFMRTGCLTQNPTICLAAQPEVNYQHLVDNEDDNLGGRSQAIQQESISNLGDNQDGNQILQAEPPIQNATVELADQVVVKHGPLVHDGEVNLDELPEPIPHQSTLETVEVQSNIVLSKNENQILQTGSLLQKAEMSLAEQAENKHRHLIHDGQGDSEELSQAIHQESTAEDVKKDEGDLEQHQNGNQILQDEFYPRNAKTSSSEQADVKHNYLVHDGEGVPSELCQDTGQESTMEHVQNNQDIQLSHNEDPILDTESLSQEEIITLAESEISPENLTRKANIGIDHGNLEQTLQVVIVGKVRDPVAEG